MDEEREFDTSLKLIAKSSVVVFIGFAFSKILTYIYRIIIARNFGPEAYGLFSLALMVASWITILAIFGLDEGLLRYISIFRGRKEENKIRYIFRASFYLLLVTGLIGGAIMFFSSSFFSNRVFNEPGLKIFLQIFSLSVPFSVVFAAFISPLKAYEKIGWYSFISNILITAVHVGFILLLVLAGLKVIAVPLSYLFGIFIGLVVSVLVLKKKVPSIFTKPKIEKKINEKKKEVFREVLAYSWPLLFAGIVWRIFHWTDSFFIGFFQNAVDVGIYNAAVPIAMLLLISSQIFMQLFYPLINKEYSRGRKETVKELSKQVGKWIFAITLPAFILLIVFPEAFLNILFGEEYIVAVGALRLLAFGAFFMSLLGISNRLITMIGKSKIIFMDIIIVAAINVVLDIFLIPRYGINGAAFATAISFLLISVISAVQAFLYLKIFPVRRKMFNIIISGLISLGILLYLKTIIPFSILSLILLAIFFLAVYIILAFLFKGFDRNDIMIFKSFLRKVKK